MKICHAFIAFLMILVSCPSWAATYGGYTCTEIFYVAEGGSGAAPETTAGAYAPASFNNAANWDTDDAADDKIGPNDCVVLLDDGGTITTALTVQQPGLDGYPIKILGESGASTVISVGSGTPITASRNYITIDGLNALTLSTTGNGVYSTGVSNVAVKNLTVSGQYPVYFNSDTTAEISGVTATASGAYAIRIAGTPTTCSITNNTLSGATSYNIYVASCDESTISSNSLTGKGIVVGAGTTATASYNYISGTGTGSGIALTATTATADNNIISNLTSGVTLSCASGTGTITNNRTIKTVDSCYGIGGASATRTIANNYCTMSGLHGINVTGDGGSGSIYNNFVRYYKDNGIAATDADSLSIYNNNISYGGVAANGTAYDVDSCGDGISLHGTSTDASIHHNVIHDVYNDAFAMVSTSAGNIYNNTAYKNGRSGYTNLGVRGGFYHNGTGLWNVKNNIFVDNYPYEIVTNAADTFSNNLYRHTGNGVTEASFAYVDSEVLTYAAYTATEEADVYGSPSFFSETDYHLQSGSAARGIGADVSLSTDYDGVSIGSTREAGAYEYVAPGTVYAKKIGSTVYYDASATSCDGVTADDTSGTLEDAVNAADTGGTLYICSGSYAGANLSTTYNYLPMNKPSMGVYGLGTVNITAGGTATQGVRVGKVGYGSTLSNVNIEVQDLTTGTQWGVYIAQFADRVKVLNSTITCVDSPSTASGWNGISTYATDTEICGNDISGVMNGVSIAPSATKVTVDRNIIHDLKAGTDAASDGVIVGAGSVTRSHYGTVISNNTISGYKDDGIDLYWGSDITVEGNDISSGADHTIGGADGMPIKCGSIKPNSGNKILRNTVHDVAYKHGIYSNYADDLVIAGNLVYNIMQDSYSGIVISANSNNAQIYNNTVIMGAYDSGYALAVAPEATGTIIAQNNILSKGNKAGVYDFSAGGIAITGGYNILVNDASVYNGTSYTNTGTTDQYATNPLFASTTNFSLLPLSPAINGGRNVCDDVGQPSYCVGLTWYDMDNHKVPDAYGRIAIGAKQPGIGQHLMRIDGRQPLQ